MMSKYKFKGIRFLVVPYAFKHYQYVAVVNIQRQTIITIDITNRKTQAKFLGEAINIKLGKLRDKDQQWKAKLFYFYGNTNNTNYRMMMCYNIKAKVLEKQVEDIFFREL